jgi:hypothetical protein
MPTRVDSFFCFAFFHRALSLAPQPDFVLSPSKCMRLCASGGGNINYTQSAENASLLLGALARSHAHENENGCSRPRWRQRKSYARRRKKYATLFSSAAQFAERNQVGSIGTDLLPLRGRTIFSRLGGAWALCLRQIKLFVTIWSLSIRRKIESVEEKFVKTHSLDELVIFIES